MAKKKRARPYFPYEKAFLIVELIRGGITDPRMLSILVGVQYGKLKRAHERVLRELAKRNEATCLLIHPIKCANCGSFLRTVPCTMCEIYKVRPSYLLLKRHSYVQST